MVLAFISYSREDAAAIADLKSKLQAFRKQSETAKQRN
jgi:hypothetical protein